MQKAIIIGATSGIGQEVARILVQQGWHIGIAGRREEALHALQATAPDRIITEQLDVTEETATLHLHNLIKKLGGIDLFFLSSGVGHQNRDLQPDIELNTARTNVEGFTRMVTAAFNYFKEKGSGHIAVISSIAEAREVSSIKVTAVSGNPAKTSPQRSAFVIWNAVRCASFPHRKMQTLPLFTASAAASLVTFGRLS